MSNLIRSFIAVPLTEEIHQNLGDFIRAYGLANRAGGFRPVKPENIHLTLKFLGDVKSDQIPSISESLEELSRNFTPFPIRLQGIGAFPGWKNRLRIIWVGVQPVEPVRRLFLGVDAVTAAIGYPSENRAFSPHLTLARVNRQTSIPYQDETINRLMNLKTSPVFGEMTVSKVILFRSTLQPTGPVYSILSQHHFSGLMHLC